MGLHRRFIKAAWSTAVEILRKVKRTWGVLHDRYGAKKPSAALASIERFLDALDAAPG